MSSEFIYSIVQLDSNPHFFKQDTLDNINLFSVITIISFILLVPAAILLEGVKFTPSYLQSAVSSYSISRKKMLMLP